MAAKKKAAKRTKKTATKKKTTRSSGVRKKTTTKRATTKKAASLAPKANTAVKKAAESIWGAGDKPHTLLKELHDVLLLRCLKEADGNYAAAAAAFGPSRQSVQQYTNSALRDARWKPYQQNKRKKR